jgi:threonine dehydrogenase-like Zn-dependent dehydrogenase
MRTVMRKARQEYSPSLLKLVEDGKNDPSFLVTHGVPLSKAA